MRWVVFVTAGLLLAAGGVLHGVWSHRWESWGGTQAQTAVARLDAVPLQIGDWTGERVPNGTLSLPEELVGRGVVIRYTDRVDGSLVSLYFACGPTDSIIAHTPPVCYRANGYAWNAPDIQVPVGVADARDCQFWVSDFAKGGESGVPVNLRVFWSYTDGRGWQVPGNPGRTFRRSPVLYKCYAIRQTVSASEPAQGDPCLRLLELMLPKLDAILADSGT